MKRVFGYIFLGCVLINNLIAEDKLDILDKQSKEFFKAITGLEKDYLEKQIVDIKKKADNKVKLSPTNESLNQEQNLPITTQLPINNQLSQEEYAKNVFKYENEMARLTTDFTRTKKLKDIKIKSMYKFNSKNYVVLKVLDEEEQESTSKESSFKIEGRYKEGDYILTHRIVEIDIQTKTVKLYKKLDEDYGYYIILSNYGISVSDLKKIEKKKIKKTTSNNQTLKDMDLKKNYRNLKECIYKVKVNSLNVRSNTNEEATILRVLKKGDEFTIKSKSGVWIKLDTIYKNISGDVMSVENENNWVYFSKSLLKVSPNCL